MSKIAYPGSREIEGPWLLDKESLQKFETMINDIVKVFCDSSGEEYKPEYAIIFVDGKSIVEQSLLDFDINNEIKTSIPQKLVVSIFANRFIGRLHCTELTFKLNQRGFQSFEYNIRGIEDEKSKLMIINRIEEWIEENQPSRFLKIWDKVHVLLPVLCFIAIYIVLYLFAVHNNADNLYQNSLLPQLQSILEHGIDESNFTTALELLLIKEYSYVPSSFEAKTDPRVVTYPILIFSIIGIAGFCCPKANIAVGAGKKRVKWWKRYEQFITVTIPTVIILPVLVNYISSFF